MNGDPITPNDCCPACGAIYPRPHFDTCTLLRTLAMPLIDPIHVPAPQPSLRKAASEVLLAGALALSDVSRATPQAVNGWTDAMKASEERFRKALEQLAEALA